MADWRDGYESTDPKNADCPHSSVHDAGYEPPGYMAEAVKARWKGVPCAYPFGKAKDGGGGGGE